MKLLRSHITKVLMAGAIWLGMMMYLVRPVQADRASNSFASWLDTVVKKGDIDSDRVRKQLYDLKESDKSLNDLIQEASEIVSRHNEDFNLPLDGEGEDTGLVYDLLVWEWNSYQTGNGMGKAAAPITIKASFHPTVDKFTQSISGITGIQCNRYELESGPQAPVLNRVTYSVHIIPLTGGVAIGAP